MKPLIIVVFSLILLCCAVDRPATVVDPASVFKNDTSYQLAVRHGENVLHQGPYRPDTGIYTQLNHPESIRDESVNYDRILADYGSWRQYVHDAYPNWKKLGQCGPPLIPRLIPLLDDSMLSPVYDSAVRRRLRHSHLAALFINAVEPVNANEAFGGWLDDVLARGCDPSGICYLVDAHQHGLRARYERYRRSRTYRYQLAFNARMKRQRQEN